MRCHRKKIDCRPNLPAIYGVWCSVFAISFSFMPLEVSELTGNTFDDINKEPVK